jgi:hypothetical protein
MNENIFISIASFRDPSLAITIKSALHHAKHPENLVFGVGAQYYPGEMPRLDLDESQLRIIYYNPDTRPGVTKVRYEISKLIHDERYFYIIDSHTLFFPGWDETVIGYLKKAQDISGHSNVGLSGCGVFSDKEVFSLQRYFLDNSSEMKREKSLEEAPIYFKTRDMEMHKTGDLTKHYHVDCSNFFTLSTFSTEVGLNKHSNFLFEEPYLSWRAFMSGWDVYSPRERYTNQNPHAYFNIVWNADRESRDYLRPEDVDADRDQLQMLFEAFVFNNPENILSIKNPKRSTNDFWELTKPPEMKINILDSVKNSTVFKHMQK